MEELEVKKVIALMSGTSCDSIDAGLCEVYPDMTVKLIQGINYKYPEQIRAKIFQLFRGEASVKDICQMNFAIGKCFAEACKVLISEFGKPAIFIPFPFATENHQEYNAKVLEKVNAAKIILDKNLNYLKLNNTINEMIADKQKLIKMGENAYKVSKPEVENKIYEEIRKSLKNT